MNSFLLGSVVFGFVLPYFVLLTYTSVRSFFLSLFSGRSWLGAVFSLQPASSWEALPLEQSAQFLGSVLDSVLVAGLSALFTLVVAGATVISIAGLPMRLRLRKALILFCGSAGGVSVFVLGLGYFSLLGSLTRGAFGSFFITCALQSVLFFPFAFRICWPLSQSIPRQEIHALQTLGGGPWESFWVVLWPRWKMNLAACFFMVAAASLGELGSVSLFMGDHFLPLPILISRWMQRYHFDQAEGAGAFLLVGCTLLMFFGMRLSRSRSMVVPTKSR